MLLEGMPTEYAAVVFKECDDTSVQVAVLTTANCPPAVAQAANQLYSALMLVSKAHTGEIRGEQDAD